MTLAEAYQLAIRQSEELAQRKDGLIELEAKISELWSAVYPKIALRHSEFLQDSQQRETSGVSGSFTSRKRPETRFTGRQPIFSGFKEYLALKAGHAARKAAESDLIRARELLYQDVAQAYFDLLGLQKEIAIRREIAKLTGERLAELRTREKIGRSRRSEVLAAEAQLAGLDAQIEAAKGDQAKAQEALRFLTGLAEELAPGEESGPAAPASLEESLAAVKKRSDLETAREELRIAEFEAKIAWRAFWPTVNLDGNYYLERTGLQKEIKWDVLAVAEIPIFQGGALRAKVHQAQARRRSAQEAVSLAQRRAASEVRSIWSEFVSATRVEDALNKAVSSAQANVKAQSEDYRLGLVDNLDVLGSLNSLQETQLRRQEADLNSALLRVKLKVATGGVDENF